MPDDIVPFEDEPRNRGREVPSEQYVAPRVEFLSNEVYPRAAAAWKSFGDGYVFMGARFHVPAGHASQAAIALYDIDRETRRAIRIIAGRGQFEPRIHETELVQRSVERARSQSPRQLLRPIPTGLGGFELLRAEPGSANFFLEAYGLLSAVLLSDPLQLALTLNSLFSMPARVLVRRLWGDEAEDRDLGSEFDFADNDLRLAGRLRPGARLELRYRNADGTEIETVFEAAD